MPASVVTACRACGGELSLEMVDLGEHPLSNAFLTEARLELPEPRYPLRVVVCARCRLAQLDRNVPPSQIFDADYAYFSSISASWVAHARAFAEQAIPRFGLDSRSLVVEVASNDGYLLRHFQAQAIPVLGIEPSANVAAAAQALGIETEVRFFNQEVAAALVAGGRRADLLIGNNVLAHVPDIDGFVAGLAVLLAPHGVVSLEFPHLLRLLEQVQFDTIYHEHYSYLSLLAVEALLERHGLMVFDVEALPTHGGSLRLLASHEDGPWAGKDGRQDARIAALRAEEAAAGLDEETPYRRFSEAVPRTVARIRDHLQAARSRGERIAGLGAAAKGNTLLNACGIGPELIDLLVDSSPQKQGRYAPGSRLPIEPPEALARLEPGLVVVLPWNLEEELIAQNAKVFDWGGQFLIPIPEPRLVTRQDWYSGAGREAAQEAASKTVPS